MYRRRTITAPKDVLLQLLISCLQHHARIQQYISSESHNWSFSNATHNPVVLKLSTETWRNCQCLRTRRCPSRTPSSIPQNPRKKTHTHLDVGCPINFYLLWEYITSYTLNRGFSTAELSLSDYHRVPNQRSLPWRHSSLPKHVQHALTHLAPCPNHQITMNSCIWNIGH